MKFSKGFISIVVLFAVSTSLFFLFANQLKQLGFDINILLWGNVFLLVLSSLSFIIQYKALQSSSPQVFTRYFYLSFVAKFMLVAITVLVYSFNTASINKNSILACMALYLVYTFVEIFFVLKTLRKK